MNNLPFSSEQSSGHASSSRKSGAEPSAEGCVSNSSGRDTLAWQPPPSIPSPAEPDDLDNINSVLRIVQAMASPEGSEAVEDSAIEQTAMSPDNSKDSHLSPKSSVSDAPGRDTLSSSAQLQNGVETQKVDEHSVTQSLEDATDKTPLAMEKFSLLNGVDDLSASHTEITNKAIRADELSTELAHVLCGEVSDNVSTNEKDDARNTGKLDADDSVTKETANGSVTKETADDSITKETADDSVIKEIADNSITKETGELAEIFLDPKDLNSTSKGIDTEADVMDQAKSSTVEELCEVASHLSSVETSSLFEGDLCDSAASPVTGGDNDAVSEMKEQYLQDMKTHTKERGMQAGVMPKKAKPFIFEAVELTEELLNKYDKLLDIKVDVIEEDMEKLVSDIIGSIEDVERIEQRRQRSSRPQRRLTCTSSDIPSKRADLSPNLILKYEEVFVKDARVSLKRMPENFGSVNIVGSVIMETMPKKQRLDESFTSSSDSDVVKCPKCRKVFMNWKYIQAHLENIHKIPRAEANELYRVAKNTPKKLPVDCPVCGKTYCSRSKTKFHMKQKHNIDMDQVNKLLIDDDTDRPGLACSVCHIGLSCTLDVRRHLAFAHNYSVMDTVVEVKKIYKDTEAQDVKSGLCPVCDRNCRDLFLHLTYQHKLQPENVIELLGPKDDSQTSQEGGALANKLKDMKVKAQVTTPSCPKCCSDFSSFSNLRQHMQKTHHLSKEHVLKLIPPLAKYGKGPKVSPNIPYSRHKSSTEVLEIKSEENSDDDFGDDDSGDDDSVSSGVCQLPVCPQCSKEVSSFGNLRVHLQNVHNMDHQTILKLVPYQNKIAKSPKAASKSTKSVHASREALKVESDDSQSEDDSAVDPKICQTPVCPQCAKEFSTFTNLRSHMQKIHHMKHKLVVELVPFLKNVKASLIAEKSIAETTFKAQKTSTDENSSDGNKVYKCSLCPGSYPRLQALIRHVVVKHRQTRSKAKQALIMKYPRDLPCELCHRKFRTKLERTRHILRHKGKALPESSEKIHTNLKTKVKATNKEGSASSWRCFKCHSVLNSEVQMRRHLICLHKMSVQKAATWTPKCLNNAKVTQSSVSSNASKSKIIMDATKTAFAKTTDQGLVKCPFCPCMYAMKSMYRHVSIHHKMEKLPFHCQGCNRDFLFRGVLERHVLVCSGEAKASCPCCLATFQSAVGMRSHLRSVHPDYKQTPKDIKHESLEKTPTLRESDDKAQKKPGKDQKKYSVTRRDPTCPECSKKFSKMKILEVHFRKRHEECDMSHVCKFCKKGYFSEEGLEMHIVRIHDDESDVDAGNEPARDNSDDSLSSDEESPRKKRKLSSTSSSTVAKQIFRCMECPMAFFDKNLFNKHREEAHQVQYVVEQAKKNEELLGKMTPQQRKKYEELLDEVASPTSSEALTILLCSECNKYFSKAEDLEEHYQTEHSKKTSSSKKLRLSLESDDGPSSSSSSRKSSSTSQKKQCSYCSQSFIDDKRRLQHQKTCNLNPDIAPSNKTASPMHKEKPSCPICGKTFVNRSGLSMHQRYCQESGEDVNRDKIPVVVLNRSPDTSLSKTKSYKDILICHICRHRCKTEGGVEQHIIMKHGEDKLPLKCPHCPRYFISQRKVNNHSSRCPGQTSKPRQDGNTSPHEAIQSTKSANFTCKVCGLDFHRLDRLQSHMKSQHPSTVESTTVKHQRLNKVMAGGCGLDNNTSGENSPEPTAERESSSGMPTARLSERILDDCDRSSSSNEVPAAGKSTATFVKCPFCDKSYQNVSRMEGHVRSFHGESKLPHQCTMCFRGYYVEASLDSHYRQVHKVDRPLDNTGNKNKVRETRFEKQFSFPGIPCTKCDAHFNSHKELSAHRKAIHFCVFSCKICALVVFSSRVLQAHYMTQHGVDVPLEQINKDSTAPSSRDSYASDMDEFPASAGSNGENNQSGADSESGGIDEVRSNILTHLLSQPSMNDDVDTDKSSSARVNRPLSANSAQPMGEVIIIEPNDDYAEPAIDSITDPATTTSSPGSGNSITLDMRSCITQQPRNAVVSSSAAPRSNFMKLFMCSSCGTTFTSRANLDLHMRVYHEEVPTGSSYQCPICQAMRPRLFQIRDHIKSDHPCSNNVLETLLRNVKRIKTANVTGKNASNDGSQTSTVTAVSEPAGQAILNAICRNINVL